MAEILEHADAIALTVAERIAELEADRDSWVLGAPDGTETPYPEGWELDNPDDSAELDYLYDLVKSSIPALDNTREPVEHAYTFDVKIFATITVKATSETEARQLINQCIDGGAANFGAWPNGDPIYAQVSMDDGENDELIKIDGEAV